MIFHIYTVSILFSAIVSGICIGLTNENIPLPMPPQAT
jgi:hypothetical protein